MTPPRAKKTCTYNAHGGVRRGGGGGGGRMRRERGHTSREVSAREQQLCKGKLPSSSTVRSTLRSAVRTSAKSTSSQQRPASRAVIRGES
jgi:hypothetical protein